MDDAFSNHTRGFARGNLNKHGNLDVVVSNSNTANSGIDLYLGNGNGTLQSPITTSSGASSQSRGVALGDLNNDGRPDAITVISGGSASVRVFIKK